MDYEIKYEDCQNSAIVDISNESMLEIAEFQGISNLEDRRKFDECEEEGFGIGLA